jgi:hypothetical protein
MEKLKFTQIFHESEEKTLTDDEKLKLIIDANPGKEDEIYEEFYDASASNGLDAFFEKYKDALEAKKDEHSEEAKNEDEEDEYNEVMDDVTAGEQVSPSENTNDAIEPVKKSDLQKVCEVLNISEGDFAIFEKYRGYNTDNTSKPEVEVLFKTPDSWPVHVGDKIKNTDPIFKNIAYRNEFILWKWAVEIFEKNGYREMYSNLLDKFTGSTRNTEMKSKGKELNDAVNAIRAHIIGNKTKVFDYATNEEIEIPNTLIFYIYVCIIPKLFVVAKSGMGTVRILSNKIHATLFRLAAGFTEEDDLYKDIILSSFNLFIGGMAGMRALYNDVFIGKTLTDNANANPLSIFDTGWLGNNAADIKNVYHRMNRSFEDVDDNIKPFTTKVVKKANGQGPIAFNGVNGKAMYYAGHSFTDDQIRDEYERGEIDDETYEFVKRDIGEARNRIREEDIEMSAFAYIASFVGSQFRNFLSEMVQAAAARLGPDVKAAIKLKYSSQQEIEDETDPAKKQKMLDDNKKWEAVYKTLYDKLNNGGISMDAPVRGKDGDAGTIGDTIADNRLSTTSPEYIDGKIEVQDNIELLSQRMSEMFKVAMAIKSDSEADKVKKAQALYSVMCMAKFIYFGTSHPEFTVRNTLDAAIGLEIPTTGKNAGRSIGMAKGQDMIRWSVESSDGSTANPYYGTGTGEIDPSKKNAKPFDLIRNIRGPIGMTYLFFDDNDNGMDFIKRVLYNNIGDIYHKCFVELNNLGINLNATNDKGQSAIFKNTLYIPGQSIITSEMDQFGANFESSSIYKKTQKDKKLTNWIACLRATPVTKETLEPLVDPSHPLYKDNRYIVEELKEKYGINLDEIWKNGEGIVDLRGFMKTNNIGIYGSPDEQRYFTNSEYKTDAHNGYSVADAKAGKKNILINDSDKLKDVGGVFKADEAVEEFFNTVFREANKEEPKKQRFTIN